MTIRKKLNSFFKKKVKEKKERDKEQRPDEGGSHPQRPSDLPTAKEPDTPEVILSPSKLFGVLIKHKKILRIVIIKNTPHTNHASF